MDIYRARSKSYNNTYLPKNMPKLNDYRHLRILSITTLITVLLLACIHGAAANQARK